jgi:hypothetical protein
MNMSPAGSMLMSGLGSNLAQQLQDETEEERKRRQQNQLAARAGFSPATQALAQGGILGLGL